MNILQYSITLSTKEILNIAELSFDNIKDHEFDKEIFGHCSIVDRDDIESAKKGYTKNLENKLRTPPYGCLIKLQNHLCNEIHNCVNADKIICSARNLNKKRLRNFPECWEFKCNPTNLKMLYTSIIHLWGEGKYFLIVKEDL